MKTILLASAAAVALLPSAALAQTTDGSPIDTILPATDGTVQAQPATRTTGDAVLDRLNALDARIKQLEARSKAQARRDDARRKIIAGALALEHAERDEEFGRTLNRLIGRFVTRPQDRALFGLAPRTGSDQDNRPETDDPARQTG